ncbi:DMT family transporter [candidate division WWE3 bacterium]|uniref:DMT family transporter n=1 Tax=candidate division WWE3 bacterium TaxID=2053526 RepID=A0A955RQ66_UNCKA|nr:DMT family transporter [candidate division WWE3 bacterium]
MKKLTASTTKGLAYLLASTLIYSSITLAIRMVDAQNVPTLSQVFLRYVVAFCFAAGYFVFSRSRFPKVTKKFWLLVLVSIIGYAATNVLFTYGILLTQVSTALFIFYLFSVITPLLAITVLKEKINVYNMAGLVVSSFSLLLLFKPNGIDTWKLGALFALGAAVTQSFYLVGRKVVKEYSSEQVLLICTFLGAMIVGLLSIHYEATFYIAGGGLWKLSNQTWLLIFLSGAANFGGWFFMSKGFEYVSATVGSLLMLIELVFSTVLAMLFFQEIPTISTIFGGMFIVLACTVVILKGK